MHTDMTFSMSVSKIQLLSLLTRITSLQLKIEKSPPGLQLGHFKHPPEKVGNDETDDLAVHTLGQHELPPGGVFIPPESPADSAYVSDQLPAGARAGGEDATVSLPVSRS